MQFHEYGLQVDANRKGEGFSPMELFAGRWKYLHGRVSMGGVPLLLVPLRAGRFEDLEGRCLLLSEGYQNFAGRHQTFSGSMQHVVGKAHQIQVTPQHPSSIHAAQYTDPGDCLH